ncbi:CD59 glycoprotein-like [Pipistrellus kuhlii]|uniref:CD59 glycoprotein-like n=1 Tax=Pipistrellus kuhlii TaxID=59472 RepID=UPI00174ED660|nr:CD59 glycoprotein-like [Pipistrellus kuhlii]
MYVEKDGRQINSMCKTQEEMKKNQEERIIATTKNTIEIITGKVEEVEDCVSNLEEKTTGSKGGFTLLGVLIILSVLYDSGPSLKCYSCINPVDSCTVKSCTVHFDSCLYIKAKTKTYYKCWKFENCNYNYLSKDLREETLQYECCKKDLCNKVKRSRSGKSITGTIALLVTPLLIAFWRLLI